MKLNISPSSDYPFVKYLLIGSTTLCNVSVFFYWYNVIVSDTSYIGGIVLSCLGITLLYFCLFFSNYEISFSDDFITITNWLNMKRRFRLDTLNRVVCKYYIRTTLHVIFSDKDNNKLFKTRYGNTKYLDYLESIGFEVKEATKFSMFS